MYGYLMPKLNLKSGLHKLYAFFFLGLAAVSLLAGLALHQIRHARDEAFAGTAEEYVEVKKARKELHYGLSAAAAGVIYVPRTYSDRLPKGLPQMRNVRKKKELFSATLLPLILRSNELIREERGRLEDLKSYLESGEPLTDLDVKWLIYQRGRYGISDSIDVSTKLVDRLLYHCDIIPPSMALAQAAIESGWGTSRFAQSGNAIFGQWVWGDSQEGMLPLGRDEGATHKVRKFDNLIDSVRSYAHNINKNRAYDDVRKRRADLRKAGKHISGEHLAHGLIKYSQRGQDYIKDILGLISYNQFSGLDHSRLEPVNKSQIKL